ncbi:MAG: hypothetical protein U0U67_12125 [Chitinophagales bacterium]
MKKLSLIILAVVAIFVACQKETSLATKAKSTATPSGFMTTSTIPGVSVLKDGVAYPNLSSTSGFSDDNIGWHIDLPSLNVTHSSSTPKASNLGGEELYCGGIKTVSLLAGQNILMGTLTYANDANNLYITYTTESDWYMTELHLYVGTLSGTPKSGGGTPVPGKFPIKATFNATNLAQSVTYTIPLSSVPANFIIAAHASVIRVDTDGDVVTKETAWANGPRFTASKNWATYIVGQLGDCAPPPPPPGFSANGTVK